jgi:hypothetical protein
VIIGAWALVAAGAVVIHDVPDFALVAGTPARWIRWVGRTGEPLDDIGGHTWRCPRTGETYVEQDGVLTVEHVRAATHPPKGRFTVSLRVRPGAIRLLAVPLENERKIAGQRVHPVNSSRLAELSQALRTDNMANYVQKYPRS